MRFLNNRQDAKFAKEGNHPKQFETTDAHPTMRTSQQGKLTQRREGAKKDILTPSHKETQNDKTNQVMTHCFILYFCASLWPIPLPSLALLATWRLNPLP